MSEELRYRFTKIVRTAVAWYSNIIRNRELTEEEANNCFRKVLSYRLKRAYFRVLNKIDAITLSLVLLANHGVYSWFSTESIEDLKELRRLLGSKFEEELSKGTWITVQVM